MALVVVLATAARGDGDADLAAVTAATDDAGCDPARAHCFELQLHIVVKDGGGLAQTPAWLATELANANTFFAPVDAGFVVAGVDVLPAADAHIVTRDDRDRFAAAVTDRRIHVFVIDKLEDVDTPGDAVFGVTWRGGGRRYIIVAADAFPRTLGHELGHVFGLPHSNYAISIMNKAPRDEPPMAQRRFADEELAALEPAIARASRRHELAERARPATR